MVWGSNSKAAEIRLYEYKDWFLTESVFFLILFTPNSLKRVLNITSYKLVQTILFYQI